MADSNLARIRRRRETTFGEAPDGPPITAMQTTRITSSDLAANKQTALSDEIRSDRQTADSVEVAFDGGGSLGIEYSMAGTYDDLYEAALCGTYGDTLPAVATTLNVTAATRAVVDGDASGAFANAVVGQWINFTGFTNQNGVNNGWRQIATVTDTNNITLVDNGETYVDETGSGDEVAYGTRVTNGVVKRSYAIEQAFTDVGIYQLFLGQRVASMNFNVTAGEVLTGSFAFEGATLTPAASTYSDNGTALAATTSPVVNGTSNVGTILIDGAAATTYIQSVDFTIDNTLRMKRALGSKYPWDIGYGRCVIGGTMNAYFENLDLYNSMINHDDVSLVLPINDINGRGLLWQFDRIKFNVDNPAPAGIDQDVTEGIEWNAIVDGTSGVMATLNVG